ncbi:MAG: HAMP domain-containing sensor histidine kinase [Anaerolineae bacterium]
MLQINADTALQSAAQHVVALNGAQAVGVAWYEPTRRDVVWGALVGPSEAQATLVGLAQRVIHSDAPVRESDAGQGWAWGAPVSGASLHGALVAIGNGSQPVQPGLLVLLGETATLAAELLSERQRSARLQRWFTASGREIAGSAAVAGLAQRINNPLTTVIGEAQLLQAEATEAGMLAGLAAIERAGQRIRDGVETVLDFVQGNGLTEAMDVNGTIEAALRLVTSELEGAGIRLTARLTPNLPSVRANASDMTEAWVHMLANARQSLTSVEEGQIRLASVMRNGYVLVTVADNGPVTVRRRRLLQPFAPDTSGSLFLAWNLVTRAGGQVLVASRPGIGTTIGARLPMAK